MSRQDSTNAFNFENDMLTPSYNIAKYSISKLYRDGGIHSQKNFISGYQKCFIDLLSMINIADKYHQKIKDDTHSGQVSFRALMVHFFEARGVSREEMVSLLQYNLTTHPQVNYTLNGTKPLLRQVQHPIHLEALKKNAIQKHSTQNISKSTKRKKAKLSLYKKIFKEFA